MLESNPSDESLDDEDDSAPARLPWQFSLKWMFGLTTVIALALWAQIIWGWLGGLIAMGVAGVVVRAGRPLRTADEIGSAAGTLAGFALVAIHGTAMEAAIYQEHLVPYNVAVGAVMFAVAGFLVGTQSTEGIHPLRYALNWGAAGSILGGAIGILTAIIADNPRLGPVAAMLFAVFVSSYMGGLLSKMSMQRV